MKKALLFTLILGITSLGISTTSNARTRIAKVSCSSSDYGYEECDAGRIDGVELYIQHSKTSCTRGDSWGVRGGKIWVDKGCRGTFEVMTRDNFNDRRDDYIYDDEDRLFDDNNSRLDNVVDTIEVITDIIDIFSSKKKCTVGMFDQRARLLNRYEAKGKTMSEACRSAQMKCNQRIDYRNYCRII